MNKRIKLLSLLASDSIPDDVSAEHAMYLFQEKFAQLIVQECVGVADHSTVNGTSIIGQRIKEHFGVEE